MTGQCAAALDPGCSAVQPAANQADSFRPARERVAQELYCVSDRSRGECPMCQGSPGETAYPYRTVWRGNVFDYVSCTSCGTTYVDPLPTDADLQEMYSREAYHESFGDHPPELPDQRILEAAGRYLDKDLPLLDFGCGSGFFINAMKANGWTCEGSELDAGAREVAAANTGSPIYSLEKLEERGPRYGTIHLGDVLEHLPDPTGMMRRLEALLLPGGRFFLQGPLADNASLVRTAVGLFGAVKHQFGRDRNSYPPYHLFRVTARVQRDYFEKRLGYGTEWFHVFESGWPYHSPGLSLLRPGSGGNAVRLTIAATAKVAADVGRPVGLQLGNRFACVVAPRG